MRCLQSGAFQLKGEAKAEQEKIWSEFAAKRPPAFDGQLLRLKSFAAEEHSLTLLVERTTFSAYITTRAPEFINAFPKSGRADPLGLTVLVVSRDGKLVLTQRSLSAEQNPGAIYFIGGYAEPSKIDGDVDLFGEAAREVKEEVGIDDLDLDRTWVIGLAYDPVYCHPELFFLAQSELSEQEIVEKSASAVDRQEAHNLYFAPLELALSQKSGNLSDLPKTWSYDRGVNFAKRHIEAAGDQGAALDRSQQERMPDLFVPNIHLR
ncbi:NUDIX domain-containing protein [Rhizobium tibeticum]|uniref:NUDIX domain-containing protein n=1 Tax=Rhizobium tibeticum TaxID=501024 RepID=UPI0027D92E57|nr:NUDIX hydrolase [Rhizobium tibeticum]